jgi:predicted methyltransferase
LIANTFHGVPDKARLARAVTAMLKPGGRSVIVNWHRRPRERTTILGQPRGPQTDMRMTPEEVAMEVAPAGLRLVRTVGLPPYHYGVIFESERR